VKNLLLLGLTEKEREVVKAFNIYKVERISSETMRQIRSKYNYLWSTKLENKVYKLKAMTYDAPLIIEEENPDVSSIISKIESEKNSSSQTNSSKKLADNLEDTTKRSLFRLLLNLLVKRIMKFQVSQKFLKKNLNENKKDSSRTKAFKSRHKLLRENHNYEDTFFTMEQDIACMLKTKTKLSTTLAVVSLSF
jgi:hypothetical protein